MNDTEKLHQIYHKLLDLSARLSVLQCLDVEMMSFSDCKDKTSHKVVLYGVSLCAIDMRKSIEKFSK